MASRSGSRLFTRFAKWSARTSGHAITFAAALLLVLVWALVGPVFRFSDTWQLTINTATTIITFLMVFVIQNTQLRDTEAMHIKLDELLRASSKTSNVMLNLEELPEEELAILQRHYALMADKARRQQGRKADAARRRRPVRSRGTRPSGSARTSSGASPQKRRRLRPPPASGSPAATVRLMMDRAAAERTGRRP